MSRFLGVASLSIVVCLGLIACPPPQQGAGEPGGGGGDPGMRGGNAINPDGCGTINTSPAGRKLYAFLVASSELDRTTQELEDSIYNACKRMAVDLGSPTTGDIQTLCNRVASDLEANLQVSVKSEKRLVTRHTPPVCHTDVNLTAGFVAQCEASADADVDVRCNGRCDGTCRGVCSTGGSDGACAGNCNGRCSGRCEGYAEVNASAECRASAEIHATTHTECTEPKVEVVQEDVTVVDATKFNAAMAAIQHGMPAILRATKRLELAGKALGHWVETGADLVQASGDLVAQMGAKSVCVGGQLLAVANASTDIQARVTVSVEVSAKVSASAGAQ
jgi:hypothetical protein